MESCPRSPQEGGKLPGSFRPGLRRMPCPGIRPAAGPSKHYWGSSGVVVVVVVGGEVEVVVMMVVVVAGRYAVVVVVVVVEPGMKNPGSLFFPFPRRLLCGGGRAQKEKMVEQKPFALRHLPGRKGRFTVRDQADLLVHGRFHPVRILPPVHFGRCSRNR